MGMTLMIKLFRFLKQYTAQIIVILILIFIQVLANLYLPTLMADIVDKGIVQKDVMQTISFLGYSGTYKGTDYIIRIGGASCYLFLQEAFYVQLLLHSYLQELQWDLQE